MQIEDISLPEIYKSSSDFRFFLKWFTTMLDKLRYDTVNLSDIYDPLRCPSWLLWMLADTMGFKYDDRLPTAYNRLVLVYFMSMIRYRGSKDGVTLAAQVNLAQFNILDYGQENSILYNRLEDTSVPVNAVYVTPHTPEGYIDVVYFTDKKPIDACIEYVRPLGMYMFQSSGVRMDARSKVIIDGRLTNTNDMNISIGPTHVGHYSRADYASMQQHRETAAGQSHTRENVWYRNSDYEGKYTPNKSADWIDPGFRSLYSLQLCNNEHIVNSLLPDELYDDKHKIFGLGYQPQVGVEIEYPDGYILPDMEEIPNEYVSADQGPIDGNNHLRHPNAYNLRYDKERENAIDGSEEHDVYTVDGGTTTAPEPAVNLIMSNVGDMMAHEIPVDDTEDNGD